MSNDVPIASLLRVERGVAAPEELAAIAVVVACHAHRTSLGRDQDRARGGARGGPDGSGGRRRTVRSAAGCWAGCWTCR
ncbi:acyl-CoA carboxylase epsilon subunit [Streptomyces sp. NPDC004311]|uniref:acyl-CoA carboxylase epsilon subunit n=1 Tax=unclassified Streptomyces TaxID=2593676 RepID=UPI0036B5BF76